MAKKRIKKALKNVAKVALPMLAVAGLGRAFMNSRARPLGVSGSKKALFTSNDAMRGISPQKMMNANELAVDLMDPNLNTGDGLGIMDMKDGGRVKRKKSKFGKKKKQANRCKKK